MASSRLMTKIEEFGSTPKCPGSATLKKSILFQRKGGNFSTCVIGYWTADSWPATAAGGERMIRTLWGLFKWIFLNLYFYSFANGTYFSLGSTFGPKVKFVPTSWIHCERLFRDRDLCYELMQTRLTSAGTWYVQCAGATQRKQMRYPIRIPVWISYQNFLKAQISKSWQTQTFF